MGAEVAVDLFGTAGSDWETALRQLREHYQNPLAQSAWASLRLWRESLPAVDAPRLNVEPAEIECYWKRGEREVIVWFRPFGTAWAMEVAWYDPELKGQWGRPECGNADVIEKLRWLEGGE